MISKRIGTTILRWLDLFTVHVLYTAGIVYIMYMVGKDYPSSSSVKLAWVASLANIQPTSRRSRPVPTTSLLIASTFFFLSRNKEDVKMPVGRNKKE